MIPDERLSAYCEAHTTAELPVLVKLNRETHLSQVYPQMLSGHLQGTFLRMLVQMIKPERILEIGTFTGYSAISMGIGLQTPEKLRGTVNSSLPVFFPEEGGGALLHTIEVNPELEDGIRRFIADAGLESQIILHIGDAQDIIQSLEETWDMIFIDADKPGYLAYYNLVLPRLRSGGFIIADNVLWDGKVIGDSATMDKDTRGIVEFNEYVHQDERVDNLVLPVRDGLMIIRKR
jgi:caffeoyl-CoA O-methyltransferase